MRHRTFQPWILVILMLSFFLLRTSPAEARFSLAAVRPAANAFELIDAVNSLRAQNGLPGYQMNTILMNIAQGHSEYQASIGAWTHYGPTGGDERDRALAAGYPVGAIDENVWMGQNLTAQQVVNNWSGDAPHLNNMLSTTYIEAGAGVACSGNYCFFTLDVASPGGSGSIPSTAVAGNPTGATLSGVEATGIVVVIPNTPKFDGSITHVVRTGESLWSLAIAYQTTSAELRAINGLNSDIIYPGDTLIIFLPKATQTAEPTASATAAPSATPFVFRTVTSSPEPPPTPIPESPVAGGSGAMIVGIIVVAALVAAGVLTAASSTHRREK